MHLGPVPDGLSCQAAEVGRSFRIARHGAAFATDGEGLIVEPIAGKLAFRSHQMWDVSIENLIPRSPICL